MNAFTRRSVLGLCGSIPLVSAGCLSRENGTEGTQLCSVSIENNHEEPVEVHLRVVEDETTLVDRIVDLGPAGTDDPPSAFVVPDAELSEDAGQYAVRMRIAGEAWEEFDTASIPHSSRVTVTGEVHANASETPYVELWYIPYPSTCDAEGSTTG